MIELLVVLIVLGVILWFVNAHIPMAAPFKTGLNIVAAIIVLLMVLRAFGIWSGGPKL